MRHHGRIQTVVPRRRIHPAQPWVVLTEVLQDAWQYENGELKCLERISSTHAEDFLRPDPDDLKRAVVVPVGCIGELSRFPNEKTNLPGRVLGVTQPALGDDPTEGKGHRPVQH